MDAPQIDQEMTVRAADHEMFLSFTNDEDAVLFHAWWHIAGLKAFLKWAEKEEKKRT